MTAAQNQSSTTENETTNGRVLIIFILICLTSLRVAIWTSSTILLFLAYGRERVVREHLRIVKFKPQLVVSNGDVLWHKTLEHFLIGSLIWMPLSMALLVLVWKFLPEPDRVATQQGTYSSWGLLAVVFLFFTAFLVPLKFTLLIAPLAIAALLFYARISARPVPHSKPPRP